MNGRSMVIALLVVACTWYGLVVLVTLQAQVDHVPTGFVDSKQTTQQVSCSPAFSGDAAATGPLPELPAGRAYQRVACEAMRRDSRWVFVFDTIVLVIGGLSAWLLTRRRRSLHRPEPDVGRAAEGGPLVVGA